VAQGEWRDGQVRAWLAQRVEGYAPGPGPQRPALS
jgi:hypothetical protein